MTGQSDAGLLAFLDFLLLTLMTLAIQPPPGSAAAELAIAGHSATPLRQAEEPVQLAMQEDGSLVHEGQVLTQESVRALLADLHPHLLLRIPAGVPSKVLVSTLLGIQDKVSGISLQLRPED